ncbi:hypothetical protein, partial [Devosia sp.]|uniref:hypothetical protein n=1 Tax=Devosia sp. TaxID=1871048 RepID=UPI001AC1FF0C
GTLPAEGLKPDTRIAASADRSQIGYLGVWAPDHAACGTVDHAGGTNYLVITSVSLRQGAELPNIVNMVPAVDGKATVKVGDRSIVIAQSGPDSITVDGKSMVRCTTP